MAEVDWTERHERLAQRLPPADADTDPQLLATVLAHLRAGRLDGLAIAKQEADRRSAGFRSNCRAKRAFDAARHEGGPWPRPTQANDLWWRLFDLACEVFEPWLHRVARRPFTLRGVTHPSAHHAACAFYADTTAEADKLLFHVEPECEYEFEMMEAIAVETRTLSFGPYRLTADGSLESQLSGTPTETRRVKWCDIPGKHQGLLWEVLRKVPKGTRFSAVRFAGGGDDSTARGKLDELHEMGVLHKAEKQRSPYYWTDEPEGVPDSPPV